MSFQIGNAQLGVTFTGDLSSLQRALDQGGPAVERFGTRTATAMRAAEVAGEDVARGFNRVGMSSAQMQAAMRGVPAQFTDIFTSLQAGQNPLTVFLQQGGQLKDMFGGIGPAARAMGAYVAGLVNPFTLGAVAIGAAGIAAYKGASEFSDFSRTLINTGGTAGVTADQLMDMAASIDAVNSGLTQSRSAEVLDEMVKAGVRGEAQLRRYAQAAAEFEAAGGASAETVAKNFEELGRNPVEASSKLTQSMGYLTAAIYQQIRSLEEQGRTLEAAKVAQDAYASALEGRTPALLQNLGAIERGWLAVKSGAKEAWDAMLNVGRPDSLSDQIKAVEDRLAAARGHKTLGAGNGFDVPDPRTAADKALLESLREQQRLSGRSADLAAERAQREQAAVTWLQQGDQFLNSQARLERDIAKARQQGLAAGKSEEEIEKRVQAIRAAASKGGAKKPDEFANLLGRLTARDAGLDPSFYKDLETLYQGYRKGRVGAEDYRAAVEELITSQRFAKDAALEYEKANKNTARLLEDNIKAAERAAESAQKVARETALEASTYGMSELQLHELAQARLADTAASLRQRAAIMDNIDLSGRASEALLAEADALDDLAKSKDAVYSKRQILSSDETIAEAVRINGRVSDNLRNDLADSISEGILDGARNGASIMDIFRSELRAQFARTVLRPIIQPVAEGMSSAISTGLNSLLSAMGMGATSSGYNPGADMGFSSSAWEQFVPSAKGNIFAGAGISAYSSQVVDRPTLFPFAKGIGLMGEAGAEGILPLRRDSSGRLGVTAAGVGGGALTVKLINESGTQLQATQGQVTQGADGGMQVEVLLQAVENRIADRVAQRSGPVSRSLEVGWGLRPAMA